MSLTLIVTEKDSVAQAFANVVGAKQNQGYYEGNGYVVTPCQGHLCELAMPDTYDSALKEWKLNTLPIIPGQIRFVVKNERRLATIREWLDNDQVDTIINACDGDREGEAIFREVYQMCKCAKPVYRVWISSTEPASVRKGLDDMKSSDEYDNLADAAYSRNVADWLIGINATRLFSLSLQSKRALTIGRVQTPTVNMVVEREREIREFKPEDYWIITALLENGLKLTHRADTEQKANEVIHDCNGASAVIKKVDQKEKYDNPPRLYDLTSLQQDCNKLLHISAADTLDNLQSLYDAGFATYPRSDSQFITDSDVDSVLAVMEVLAGERTEECHPENIRNIVNNAKVVGHPAILPTVSGAEELLVKCQSGYENLNIKWKILLLIAFRLLEATSDARVYLSTSVKADIEGYTFTASGSVTKADGWKTVARAKREALGQGNADMDKDNVLPDVEEGNAYVCEDTAVEKKQTTPPPRYNEATLLEAMRTCGKKLEDEDQREAMKDRGLGTPATRADILERIIISGSNDSGYITRGNDGKDKSHLYPTNRAIALMKLLPTALKDPATTGAWEYSLSQIEHGDERKEAFLEDIEDFVRELVDSETEHPRTDDEISRFAGNSYATILGICPICGGAVVPFSYSHDKTGKPLPKKRTGYRCTTKGCTLIGSNVIGKKTITNAQIKRLLETGSAGIITGLWSEKKQRYFEAEIILEQDDAGVYTGRQTMKFPQNEVCNCPACGNGKIVWFRYPSRKDGKQHTAYKCNNKDCSVEPLWPRWEHDFTQAEVKRLFTTGRTGLIQTFKTKDGNQMSAKIAANRDELGRIIATKYEAEWR